MDEEQVHRSTPNTSWEAFCSHSEFDYRMCHIHECVQCSGVPTGKLHFKKRPGSCLSDNTTVFPLAHPERSPSPPHPSTGEQQRKGSSAFRWMAEGEQQFSRQADCDEYAGCQLFPLGCWLKQRQTFLHFCELFSFDKQLPQAKGISLFKSESYGNSINLHFRSSAEVMLEMKYSLQETEVLRFVAFFLF